MRFLEEYTGIQYAFGEITDGSIIREYSIEDSFDLKHIYLRIGTRHNYRFYTPTEAQEALDELCAKHKLQHVLP